MAKTIQTAIEAGSRMAPAKFYIKITPDGPYLLYGNPPMDQEIIVPNDEGSSWTYRKGNHFSTTEEPTALCRCGASKNKPSLLRWFPSSHGLGSERDGLS